MVLVTFASRMSKTLSFSVHRSSLATLTVTARGWSITTTSTLNTFLKDNSNVKELKMVGSQGFHLKDWIASSRNLVRLKTAYTSSLATIASLSGGGGGGEGMVMEGSIAEAELEVVPESPGHDRQYVLVDPPDYRRTVAGRKAQYIFC